MSRSTTVKFLDELQFSAKKYSGAVKYGRLQITSASLDGSTYDATVRSKLGSLTATQGDSVIIVPVTPVTREVKIKYDTVGTSVTFAAGTPIGNGKRLTDAANFTGTFAFDGQVVVACADFASGDSLVFDFFVDYEELSETETDFLYVESKSGSTPEFTRSIKEKGEIRHRKHNLDPDRTLSVSQKYQAQGEGLLGFSDNEYILRAKRLDDNYLVATEYDYYYRCYHHAPEPSGSAGATDSTLSFDITYETRVSIEA